MLGLKRRCIELEAVMRGVRMRDGTEPGGSGSLDFDLAEILAALGPVVRKSRWVCSELNYVTRDNRDVEALERAFRSREPISGEDILKGAAATLQVVDGLFAGLDEDDSKWVVVRSVDSTWWEVWSDHDWVLDAIRSRFRVVDAAPQEDCPV
jgi:hypothetical protein